MPNYDDVATRWRDIALGRSDRANYSSNGRSVWGRGDTLYSYGTHFPLVELLRDGKGNPRLFLLNGDRYSVTTARHQSVARDVVGRVKEDVPSVVIPFAALDAAGIDRATLELVDDEPERHETIPHTLESETCWPWHVDGIKYAWRDETRWRKTTEDEREAMKAAGEPYPPWQVNEPTGNRLVSLETFGQFPKWGVTADVPEDVAVVALMALAGCDVSGIETAPIVYRWNTYRHWLGESLIRARVRYVSRAGNRRNRWAYFLSGFDENERRPLYFLCELPKVDHAPTTVREAYRDLMPETVKLAVAMGKDVKRQGDIYAIPTELTTRQLKSMGATFGRKNHRIKVVAGDPVPMYGPRLINPNYTPSTDERALYRLQYIAGKGTVAHGCMVPTSTTVDLDDGTETARLLGTNHVGTYVARLPNGTTLARGTMTHDPGFRGPDHSRVTLGNAWHVILKNTVPVVR